MNISNAIGYDRENVSFHQGYAVACFSLMIHCLHRHAVSVFLYITSVQY